MPGARCVTFIVYHVSGLGSLSKSSVFNTTSCHGVVRSAPIARTLLAGSCRAACPRHLITGRRNLSRLHLER